MTDPVTISYIPLDVATPTALYDWRPEIVLREDITSFPVTAPIIYIDGDIRPITFKVPPILSSQSSPGGSPESSPPPSRSWTSRTEFSSSPSSSPSSSSSSSLSLSPGTYGVSYSSPAGSPPSRSGSTFTFSASRGQPSFPSSPPPTEFPFSKSSPFPSTSSILSSSTAPLIPSYSPSWRVTSSAGPQFPLLVAPPPSSQIVLRTDIPSPIEKPSSLDLARQIDKLNYLEPPHLNTIGNRINIANILARIAEKGLTDEVTRRLYVKLGDYKEGEWGPLFNITEPYKDTVDKAIEQIRTLTSLVDSDADQSILDNIDSYWYLLTMFVAKYLGSEDDPIEDVVDAVTLPYNVLILLWSIYGNDSGKLFGDVYLENEKKTLEMVLDEAAREVEADSSLPLVV